MELAFARVNRRIEWRGHGLDEKGIDRDNGEVLVAVDPRYYRPTEVECLLGDARKARERLGWAPRTSFAEMIAEMVDADLEQIPKEAHRHGSY